MSAFLSTVILLLGGFLFAVALVYWDKGGYANNFKALWWGIASLVVVSCGVAFTFYHNVVLPSKVSEPSQANATQQQSADRPWISVEVTPGGPITFQNGTQATIPVKYRLTNTGHSPANDVRMKFDIVFPAFGSSPINRQRQIAQLPRAASVPFSSGVVFAGAPAEYQTAHIVSIDQMMAFATEEMKKNGPVEWTQPYIVGCINYTFGQSDFSGETGFIYEIKTRSLDNPKITLLLKINADVPEERLVFERYVLGGDYAK